MARSAILRDFRTIFEPDRIRLAGKGESLKSTRPATRKDKYIIIATVIAIFIVAGLIVIFFRACGGDKPAPTALTSSGSGSVSTVPAAYAGHTAESTQTETAEIDSGIQTATPSPPSVGIHSIDWPGITGAAASSASPSAVDYGFVESVIYADLTGDGQEDALVLVRQQGSGAFLDYYIYDLEAGAPVMLFERQGVSHGEVKLGNLPLSFEETEAVYGPNDPNCCPGNLRKTVYTWSASAKVFVETTMETVPAP